MTAPGRGIRLCTMTGSAQPPTCGRALVIGASMAGLLAARVLSERFGQVLLLERDTLPEGAAPRKGTPQAIHPHGLLARGREAIETLFPGFTAALIAQGAVAGDIGEQVGFDADRRRFARQRTGHLGLAVSRLAIEAELRRRVLARPNVGVLAPVDVNEPVFDLAGSRVSGVRFTRRTEGAGPETIDADLVVDCSGRASHSPQWLREAGFEAPAEERVIVGLCYTSAYFVRDRDAPMPLICLISAATPGLPRPAVLLAQEPDGQGRARWVVAVGGYAGDHAAATIEALRERAQAIGGAEIIELAERGELIGDVLRYQFPHSQRRRYERVAELPRGYLVMGDAIASFNPIYGQGMTVAACESLALRDALGGHAESLQRRFFKAAARIVDIPWQLAVGSDLALPAVQGSRPLPVRVINAYIARLQRAAVHDPVVAGAFVKVVQMVSDPSSLFAPRVVWRVLRHGGQVTARAAARAPVGALS